MPRTLFAPAVLRARWAALVNAAANGNAAPSASGFALVPG